MFARERVQQTLSRMPSSTAVTKPDQPMDEQVLNLNERQQAIFNMQQSNGNQAVQRQLAPTLDKTKSAAADIPDAPDWATDEAKVRLMQKELIRLGVYSLGVDGDYGPGTDAALVEAFGGDEFRLMLPEDVVDRLHAAKPSAGRRGDRNLRYGEMFKDGVLDMTLGLGYDEFFEKPGPDGVVDPARELKQFQDVLAGHGFVEDRETAAKIYEKAGRTMAESAFGQFYVKENALTYKPPAGSEVQIHAVVRLVSNPTDDHGADAASAFEEGMAQSDVSFYAGHGRYGSGPDFDRNFESFELKDEEGNITQTILDYEVLEKAMAAEGAAHKRGAWDQFMWRVNNDRINVNLKNEGNVFINPQSKHSNEFGGKLIYWALEKTGNQVQTGEEGALAAQTEQNPERKYRVMVFDGCRTQDYEKSIRSTPGYSTKTTDTITTNRTVSGDDDKATLAAFLDSILGQQSATQVAQGMNKAQKGTPSPFVQQGTKYDPTIR